MLLSEEAVHQLVNGTADENTDRLIEAYIEETTKFPFRYPNWVTFQSSLPCAAPTPMACPADGASNSDALRGISAMLDSKMFPM